MSGQPGQYILELSGGERGLRELLLELARDYGPVRPFSEATIFETRFEIHTDATAEQLALGSAWIRLKPMA